jgi:hypothetical protein
MSKRKRPGRMMSHEMRQADRAAIVAHETAIGPDEVQRLADVAIIGEMHTDDLRIAQAFVSESDDPGWGFDLPALSRQYRRLTGRSLTRAEALECEAREEDRLDAQAEDNYLDSEDF